MYTESSSCAIRNRKVPETTNRNSVMATAASIGGRDLWYYPENKMSKIRLQSSRMKRNEGISPYGSNQRSLTSSNKVLDFIAKCFWRCSPGCQQIPTVNP